jgi:hypothetical protein
MTNAMCWVGARSSRLTMVWIGLEPSSRELEANIATTPALSLIAAISSRRGWIGATPRASMAASSMKLR